MRLCRLLDGRRSSHPVAGVTTAWREVLRERYSERYPYMLFHEHDGAIGLGVLSRYPLTASDLRTPPNASNPAWHLMAETPAGCSCICGRISWGGTAPSTRTCTSVKIT
jgi:hypothetical protein